jgi:hypothetical protein
MILKVVSGGLGKSTHFEDAKTGEVITFEGVRGVSWEQRRNAAVLTVEFHTFELAAKGIRIPLLHEDEPGHRLNEGHV